MLTIRTLEPGDASTVARLHTASWRATYRGILRDDYLDGDIDSERLALWTQRLTAPDPRQQGWLAQVGTQPVGFAFVIGAHDPQWGMLLDNLHVLPGQQGLGIGRRLLHELTGWAQQHYPALGIYLWVYELNSRTRAWYERLGAEAIEHKVIPAPGGGTVAEWLYAWRDIEMLRRATSG
jgi:GNAT superfamily N-acetyltransferase